MVQSAMEDPFSPIRLALREVINVLGIAAIYTAAKVVLDWLNTVSNLPPEVALVERVLLDLSLGVVVAVSFRRAWATIARHLTT